LSKIHRISVLIIVVLNLHVFCFGQGSWEKLNVSVTNNLNSLHFTDSITGWAVGDSGIIVHTSDGGENWTIQESNTTNNIIDVFFLNDRLGWATSHKFSSLPYGSLLLETIDGGLHWDTISYPEENIFITTIFYLDSLRGWMGGTPHALVKTIDGGQSWQPAVIDTSTLAFFPILNIEFYDEQYGFASGGIFDIAGVIWRTSNGGENWYAIDPIDAPADEVHGLYLFDSLDVIGSGGDPDFGYGVGMMRTRDGGMSWEYDEIGVQGIAYDVDFVTDSVGWAPLGPERKFVYTKDMGSTWEETQTPESTSIFDITFPDSLHGYAVGWNGAFLKYVPGIHVGIDMQNSVGFYISQNYPNPASNTTRINIELANTISTASSLYISITDIVGYEVHRTVLENKGGLFDVVLDVSELPAGIYYYKLVAGKLESEVKSMVLIN